MSRKLVFVLSLFTLFSSLPFVRFNLVEVKTLDGFRVHNIDTMLNYTTIQEAIDASETVDGHTIFVEEGIYYEHVVVYKSLSLTGENRSNTIIDGNKMGKTVKITANNTRINGFTIQRAGFTPWGSDGGVYLESSNNIITDNIIANNDDWGIWLDSSSSNNTITYNNITNNWRGCMLNDTSGNNLSGNDITNHGQDGICVWNSSNNVISINNVSDNVNGIKLESSNSNNLTDNKIKNNLYGISLLSSSNNMFRNNRLNDNFYGLQISWFLYLDNHLSYFIQDIDASNTVNGEPICYLVNHHNEQVTLDAGFVALVNCTNITVENLNLKDNAQGMVLAHTNNSQIQNLNVTNNEHGIYLYRSNDNVIFDSHISNNRVGISLETSFGNNIDFNSVTKADEGILLSYSTNNNIVYNHIANNKYRGVFVGLSSENNIAYNNITDNKMAGIGISSDGKGTLENNLIQNNNLINNSCGVQLGDTSGNKCYQNNFINNTMQASVHISSGSVSYGNEWDRGYPYGGNYWSDYNGTDSDHDGIGDTPYIIGENNQDNYPLMGLFYEFNTFLGYPINIISNSTIEAFEYFESNSTIKVYVFNMTLNQTFGFCRVCIPYELINVTSISVIIDNGDTAVLYPNYNVYDNSTHRWIYFAYEHTGHKIDIIQEYLSLFILSLFMTATLLAVTAYRRKYYT